MKKAAFFVLFIVAAAGGYWYWQYSGRLISTRAEVESRLVFVAAAVPGEVRAVRVAPGDSVVRGQTLLILDNSGPMARLARERASLAEAAAALPKNMAVPSPTAWREETPGKSFAALRAEESAARAAVEVAAGVLASANITFARLESGAASAQGASAAQKQAARIARDEAAIVLDAAKEALEQASLARARREAMEKKNAPDGTVSSLVAARLAEYQARLSRVDIAERELAATTIVAPESGRIAALTASPGTVLAVGDAPVLIAPENGRGISVTAYFPATAAGKISPDQACAVVFADDAKREGFTGRVDTVLEAPEEGGEIPVRVLPDQSDVSLAAFAGRPVVVTVFTHGRILVK